MSRNLKLFSGAAVLFYLAGIMNEAPALFVMSGVCAACLLGCYVISRLAVSGLSLQVELNSGHVWAGHEAEVEFTLTNIGLIPRPAAPVLVELVNHTVVMPPQSYLFPLPPLPVGQSVHGSGAVVPPCRGELLLQSPRLVGSDPLGMFTRLGPPLKSLPLLALPRPIAISRDDLTSMLSEHARLQGGSRHHRRGDFIGVRPHEATDELREVHWKLAAHAGELLVKQYTRGRDHSVALWLDTRAANVVGEGADSSFECQVTAAASLIQAISDCGLDQELFGEGLPVSLRSPDRGQSTCQRWLVALARVKPAGQRTFAANVADWAAQTRAGTTVFVLTSGLESETIGQLRGLLSRGVGVRVLLCGTTTVPDEMRGQQLAAKTALHSAGVPAAMAEGMASLPRAIADLATVRVSGGRGVLQP